MTDRLLTLFWAGTGMHAPRALPPRLRVRFCCSRPDIHLEEAVDTLYHRLQANFPGAGGPCRNPHQWVPQAERLLQDRILARQPQRRFR